MEDDHLEATRIPFQSIKGFFLLAINLYGVVLAFKVNSQLASMPFISIQ